MPDPAPAAAVAGWVDELNETMTRPDRRWSAPDVLDLIVAAKDMHAWVQDARSYGGSHRHGWVSAVADLHAAAKLVGPQLRVALRPHLARALAATRDLPGANPFATLPGARLTADTALTALRGRWGETAVLEAAWDDLKDACHNPRTCADTVAARRDLLWQLIRTADRSPQELFRRFRRVLADDARAVAETRVQLGNLPAAPGTWPPHREPAGLTDLERAALCRRLLTTPTAPADHVVWVAFDQASLDGVRRDVGPITFWDGAWVRGTLKVHDHGWDSLPAELTNPDSFVEDRSFPDGDRVVLARVDLGTKVYPNAPRVAAERAEAVVTIANVRTGDRVWRPRSGYVHAVDGRVIGWSVSSPPQDALPPPSLDRADKELGRLAVTLGPRLRTTDPKLTEVVEMTRWWQETADRPALAAIILDVRILQLTATRVASTGWYDYLDAHLKAWWIHDQIIDTIHRVVYAATHDFRLATLVTDHARLQELTSTIFDPTPDGRWVFHADQAVDALAELAAIWPAHDPVGRSVHTLAARLASVTALETWRRTLVKRWTRLRDRVQRVRNALEHAGPVTVEVAEAVHPAAHRLAGVAVARSLEALLAGDGLADTHNRAADRTRIWGERVAGARDVDAALFPPDPVE